MMADAQTDYLIDWWTNCEITPKTGWRVMTCYSYQTEALTLNMLNAYANEEFIVLVRCSVMLQVKHTLRREISLLIKTIHLVLFNFRFERNMATWTMLFKIS